MAGKDIRFDVDYEYRQLPDGPSGVISELPLDLLLHQTDHGPQLLYGEEFDADPLAQFEISDVTDKENPEILATTSSPDVGYIHQGWLTDDHRYFKRLIK